MRLQTTLKVSVNYYKMKPFKNKKKAGKLDQELPKSQCPTHGTMKKSHRTLTAPDIRNTNMVKQSALFSSPRKL